MAYQQKSSGSELTGNGNGDEKNKSLSAFQKAFKEARANEQDQFKFEGKTRDCCYWRTCIFAIFKKSFSIQTPKARAI